MFVLIFMVGWSLLWPGVYERNLKVGVSAECVQRFFGRRHPRGSCDGENEVMVGREERQAREKFQLW